MSENFHGPRKFFDRPTPIKNRDLLAPNHQVTGKACHPERNARDLRKISPFGRNDKFLLPLRLCVFAGDIPTPLVAALPR
jgi:hypothetical protein